MQNAIYNSLALGDFRPISIDVTPLDSDTVTLVSASYRITRHRDPPGTIWDAGGACTVTRFGAGFSVATPLVLFNSADTYTVNFTLVWSDGQIDNSVNAIVLVLARGDTSGGL